MCNSPEALITKSCHVLRQQLAKGEDNSELSPWSQPTLELKGEDEKKEELSLEDSPGANQEGMKTPRKPPCQKQKRELACTVEMKEEYTYVDGHDSKTPRGDIWQEPNNKKEAASFSGQVLRWQDQNATVRREPGLQEIESKPNSSQWKH